MTQPVKNPFPIIDTLLSIPFSLIHNIPRLTAIAPLSIYQQQLATMGLEIISEWWWDPPPDLINESEKICLEKTAINQRVGPRSPKPHPIHHQSRNGTTFSMEQIIVPHGTQTTHPSNWDPCVFELPSGQILLGTIPSFSLDGDELELLLTPGREGLVETGYLQHTDKEIVTGAVNLPVTYEACDFQSVEGTEFSDDIDAMEDVEENPPTGPSSSEFYHGMNKLPNLHQSPSL